MFHSTLQNHSFQKICTGSAVFGFNGKEKLNQVASYSDNNDNQEHTNIEHTQPELLNNYNYALNEEFDYLDDDKQPEQKQPEESKE